MLEQHINILPVDKLAGIVGGRFRLVALINRRMRELLHGSPMLVPFKQGERMIETVAREIEEGKIWLELPQEEMITTQADDFHELFDMDD